MNFEGLLLIFYLLVLAFSFSTLILTIKQSREISKRIEVMISEANSMLKTRGD